MITGKDCTYDSRLLQESNLVARQPLRAPHYVIQAATSKGRVQGPYVAARVRFESATFRNEGTEQPPRPSSSGSCGRMWTRGGGQKPDFHVDVINGRP